MIDRWFLMMAVLAVFTATASEEFVIYENGKAQAVFEKLSPHSEDSLLFFNATMKKVCGTTLPTVAKEQLQPKSRVIKFEVIKSGDLRTDDNFSFEFPDQDTMLIKCTDVSMRWALNWILEKYVGVRWLFPEECGLSFLPVSKIAIPRKPETFTPSFNIKRFVERTIPNWYPKAYYKNTLEMNHLLLKYVFPMEKYGKNAWPASIMPVLNGKKLIAPPEATPNSGWQPCYTHPDTLRLAIKNILEYLDRHPDSKSISLIQNDTYGACECEVCLAANKGDRYCNSETYFRWANAVAEAVSLKYPDVMFTTAGYVLTKIPPSFNLHKNIAVIIALDLYQCVVPEIMAAKKKYIDEWNSKASLLGVWDYAWGYGYVLPRVYFNVHIEMLRYLHSRNCRIYFSENECFDAKEGPKNALIAQALLDIDLDAAAMFDEWCLRCVGKEAAPYLREYYLFWEKFMAGPEIQATPWFQSAYTSVYMIWDSDVSHMYAVGSDEMKQARQLMEKVLQLASAPAEKERARLLFRHFEYMETILKLYGAELLPPSNLPENAQQVAAFLHSFKDIPGLMEKRNALAKPFMSEPGLAGLYQGEIYKRRIRFAEPASQIMLTRLISVLDFTDSPEVAAELKVIAGMPGVDRDLAAVAKTLSEGVAGANVFPAGDMEALPDVERFALHPEHRAPGTGVISSEKSYSGKSSFKVLPGEYSLIKYNVPAEPDSQYLVTFKLFVQDSTPGSTLSHGFFPARNGQNQAWGMFPVKTAVKGQWHTCTYFNKTKANSDAVNGLIFLRKFAPGQAIFIDDVKLVKIQ